MLKFWTAAETELVARTLGKALKGFRPNIPEHSFTKWFEDGPALIPAKGELVVVCGARPLTTLQKAGLAPKGRTVGSLRESPIKSETGGWYLVSLDPGTVHSEPSNREIIDWDVRLAHRLLTTGSLSPPPLDCQYVRDYSSLIAGIEAEFESTKRPVEVSVDTETMGFYPWYPDKDIVSISFTHERGKAQVLYTGSKFDPVPPSDQPDEIWNQLHWLMTSPKVRIRAANGKYDMVWIAEKWGIECTNFKFDSMLVGSLLNENRSNSLELHAKLFTNYGGYDLVFNKTQDKGHMENIDPKLLLPYAGGDTIATQDVSDVLKDELLQDSKLTNFYVKILHPAARAFEKIERRGVVIDKDKMEALAEELKIVVRDSEKTAMSLLPKAMRIKYREKIQKQTEAGKSPLLPSILSEFFFTQAGLGLTPIEVTEKTKQPSMTKAHLRMFGDVPEAKAMVEALTTMDSASKTLSTFVEGFLKHLRPDGRLHPTYFLAHGAFEGQSDDGGTVTGRLSAKDPAVQTLPKKTKWAKKLRACYGAPPGKVVASFDFSQGELKIVACVANEKQMIEAYQKGLDLHAVTGAKLADVPLDLFLSWKNHDDKMLAEKFDKNRGNAKPANFGLLYGMGAEGFQAYAWLSYGIKLTLEEATKMRNAFFELYPGLLGYHADMRKLVNSIGEVRTPLGRIRHLPTVWSRDRMVKGSAERQAINSPIQGCLSDMMLWAIGILEDSYPNSGLEIVAMIHDAVIVYFPEGQEQLWGKRIMDVMANLPFHEVGWKPQLTFNADGEYGPDLASMKPIKFAA